MVDLELFKGFVKLLLWLFVRRRRLFIKRFQWTKREGLFLRKNFSIRVDGIFDDTGEHIEINEVAFERLRDKHKKIGEFFIGAKGVFVRHELVSEIFDRFCVERAGFVHFFKGFGPVFHGVFNRFDVFFNVRNIHFCLRRIRTKFHYIVHFKEFIWVFQQRMKQFLRF